MTLSGSWKKDMRTLLCTANVVETLNLAKLSNARGYFCFANDQVVIGMSITKLRPSLASGLQLKPDTLKDLWKACAIPFFEHSIQNEKFYNAIMTMSSMYR